MDKQEVKQNKQEILNDSLLEGEKLAEKINSLYKEGNHLELKASKDGTSLSLYSGKNKKVFNQESIKYLEIYLNSIAIMFNLNFSDAIEELDIEEEIEEKLNEDISQNKKEE